MGKTVQSTYPERTATNIRTYSLKSLQKLLNITLLYNNGFKISKIAKVPEDEIPTLVKELVAKNSEKGHAINAMKLAMVNFDAALFGNTYNSLLNERNFREIFHEVFLPLMGELGLLWQTDSISPAHEHFISHLIKQKVYVNTERLLSIEPTITDKVFVLYLPENEIHELGLLYLNYELVLRGYKTIFLGQTMPLEFMVDLKRYYNSIIFVSYFTVAPTKDNLHAYIDDFNKILNTDKKASLWILGRMVQHLQVERLAFNIKTFNSLEKFLDHVTATEKTINRT